MTTPNTDTIIRDGEGVRVSRTGEITRIVKDRAGVHVPLMLMDYETVADDGRLHRPGQRTSNDAATVERCATAYHEHEDFLRDAWCTPEAAPVITEDKEPIADARAGAHDQMVRDLQDAWRGGAQ